MWRCIPHFPRTEQAGIWHLSSQWTSASWKGGNSFFFFPFECVIFGWVTFATFVLVVVVIVGVRGGVGVLGSRMDSSCSVTLWVVSAEGGVGLLGL